MLPYAGYVDPESTLAIGVHHDGHLEATERTFCSLYHTFMFGFTPFAHHPSTVLYSMWQRFSVIPLRGMTEKSYSKSGKYIGYKR